MFEWWSINFRSSNWNWCECNTIWSIDINYPMKRTSERNGFFSLFPKMSSLHLYGGFPSWNVCWLSCQCGYYGVDNLITAFFSYPIPNNRNQTSMNLLFFLYLNNCTHPVFLPVCNALRNTPDSIWSASVYGLRQKITVFVIRNEITQRVIKLLM